MIGDKGLRPVSTKEDFLHAISVRIRLAAVLGTAVVIAGCPSLASTLTQGCTKATTISVGDTVQTAFGTNSCQEADGTWVDFYNLTLANQGNLVLATYSPGLRTFVQVYNSQRTPVASSDVFQTPDSTASMRVMLAGPASYQIAVRDSIAGTQGSYRFSVTPDTAPAAGCGIIWITPGISTTQRLTNSDCTASSGGTTHYYHHYEIVMLFSQANTFTDTSTAYSPSMTLFESTGSYVNSTLDTTSTVATIQAFAQAQDYYQLWVGSAAALQTGQYKLYVK